MKKQTMCRRVTYEKAKNRTKLGGEDEKVIEKEREEENRPSIRVDATEELKGAERKRKRREGERNCYAIRSTFFDQPHFLGRASTCGMKRKGNSRRR
uniref:Uncharacterized protein n=1 Tax=Caenorhabditis tropicalis TaxID=1561998 RepID=A0A1I7TW98_9PELO